MPVHPDRGGYLDTVDAFAVGNAIIELGGGRRTLEDTLDLSVGLGQIAATGSEVDAQTPLAVVHAASRADAERAAPVLRSACTISDSTPDKKPVVYDTILPN